MKFINFLVFVAVLSFSGINVKAQDCKVLLKTIAGKYTGDCKGGKAEGNGKSEGKDQYTGEFKAGLPDGKGTYIWANGDAYDGLWTKGARNGKGTMSKKGSPVVTGFWEKDKYIGEYEKPYVVYQVSNSISKSDIKKDGDKDQSIQLNISNTTGGAMSLLGGTFPKPDLSDILVSKGSYAQITDGLETTSSIKKTLAKVIFPFRAKLTIDGQNMEFEILDPGQWTITIEIQANLVNGGVKN